MGRDHGLVRGMIRHGARNEVDIARYVYRHFTKKIAMLQTTALHDEFYQFNIEPTNHGKSLRPIVDIGVLTNRNHQIPDFYEPVATFDGVRCANINQGTGGAPVHLYYRRQRI